MCARLFLATVFVVGAACGLGLLPVERFPELAFGVILRCISHVRSVARCRCAVAIIFDGNYRIPGGMP